MKTVTKAKSYKFKKSNLLGSAGIVLSIGDGIARVSGLKKLKL